MLPQQDFKNRRRQLMRQMTANSIALLASAIPQHRNRDAEYPYRQDSDFHYLTGFDEPEAVLALTPKRKEGEYVLFCREYDAKTAIWTGKMAGLAGASKYFGVDQALPIDQLDQYLPDLLENRDRVYFPLGYNDAFEQRVMQAVRVVRGRARAGVSAPTEFVVLDSLLHEMRLRKSAGEIQMMKKAVAISAQAHRRAMQICQPGLYEYQIEAELLHEFTLQGARAPAYPSIVAAGNNACVLHYTRNDTILKSGELLLIDAGAEYGCYAADITRTFPVNGKFSEPQRALYELVLEAQLAAIAQIKPGKHWNEPHEAAVEVLTKGLVKLGLLKKKKSLAKLLEKESYKKFYMHRTGHWLGMDVHDVGSYKVRGEWRILEPGMVMTVEPGLYIAADNKDVDACWRGIGIRIEDDVLVTREGCEVLTAEVPKTVDEIENWMQHP